MANLPGASPNEKPAPKPYIGPETQLREFTVRGIILGVFLGVIFGASSLYLVLLVGLTVSASIPVAVISLTLFRLLAKFGFRDANILENNIVQTAGSAGESIAFGVGVTMPAIMILGFDLDVQRVILVGTLGALLGILMMIPLRRALIVQQHEELKYPEGTACAEVLKAGADEESRAVSQHKSRADAGEPSGAAIFGGFALGLVYKTAMSAFRAWKDVPAKIFGPPLNGGSVAVDISPELVGVGYIIGPRISCIMAAGGVLSYLVLIPIIKFFGASAATAIAPGTIPISQMSPDAVRKFYVLYIGAGAVATGGIISLIKSLPVILRGVKAGLSDFGASAAAARAVALRTDRDLSMKFVIGGCLLLVAAIWATPTLQMNWAGAILIVIFGFLFVTVSSRLTGEIGSSSNPISGMTIATVLLTCLAFLAAGWTAVGYYVTALSVGGIVCVAASNGGSTSQDLKTGYLVGATPKYQQIAIMIGAFFSALAMGPILLALNNNNTIYVPAAQVAPGLHAPADAKFGPRETLTGPQAANDSKSYRTWHVENEADSTSRKYLVDDSGAAVYLADPGINGEFTKRPDGSEVKKFSAPKAVLISYIIKGILKGKLPWALLLFGVMIAGVLELCGISSLAFAVGVYIPIESSMPLLVGGVVRWLADGRRRIAQPHLTDDEHSAESDRSAGVLLASGYIAAGSIGGIIVAFLKAKMPGTDDRLEKWAAAHNPFYAGPHEDLLAMVPFVALTLVLLWVGMRYKKPAAA